jgi:hypothetical protein
LKGEWSVLTAKDVFEQLQAAALKSTDEEERPLQIDYSALETKISLAMGDRKIAHLYINAGIPHGYEDQGRFNALAVTQGNVLFDMVIGDDYFRYDIFSINDVEKTQIQYGIWKDEGERGTSGDLLKAQEKPFVSFTLMHGEESHLLVALDDPEREKTLTELVSALSVARYPE